VRPTHDGNLIASVAGFPDILFDRSKASLECRHFAELKGWKFTLEDAAAKSRTEANGFKPSAEEKYNAIKAIADHYMSGVTTWGRRATGEAKEDHGLTILALMRVRGLDVDGANALVDKIATAKGLDRKAVLANMAAKNAEIIRATADIKAERAAESRINAVDLLSEMMAAGDDESDDDTPDEEEDDEEALM
jgi:hypothetical protein